MRLLVSRPVAAFLLITSGLMAQSGCSWTAPPGANGSIADVVVWDDGAGPDLYVTGTFNQVGGVTAVGIARWDGTTWSGVAGGLGGSAFTTGAASLAGHDDGSGPALWAVGSFTGAGASMASGVARFDGTSWQAMPPPPMVPVFSTPLNRIISVDHGSGPVLYGIQTALLAPSSLWSWNGSGWTMVASFSGSLRSAVAWDDGTGEKLVVSGNFNDINGQLMPFFGLYDGVSWTGVPGTPSQVVLSVMDSNAGPRLLAASGVSQSGTIFGPATVWPWAELSATGWIAREIPPPLDLVSRVWLLREPGGDRVVLAGVTAAPTGGGPVQSLVAVDRGFSWDVTALGNGGDARGGATFDDGSGPALWLGGTITDVGGQPAMQIARLVCSPPTLELSQPQGAGGSVLVTNRDLVTGGEYFNLFTLTPCPGSPGSGSFFGLCASTPNVLTGLLAQATVPLDRPPFHWTAAAGLETWGPYPPLPATIEGVCIEVTGGTVGLWSPVERFTPQ